MTFIVYYVQSSAISYLLFGVWRLSQKPHVQISPSSLHMLPVDVAQFSSDAMQYIMYFPYCD